jgi:predicted ATP-dependent serine protease
MVKYSMNQPNYYPDWIYCKHCGQNTISATGVCLDCQKGDANNVQKQNTTQNAPSITPDCQDN